MPDPNRAIRAMLPDAELDRLRAALRRYTADDVAELLGPVGGAAHSRGDLAGVARAVRSAGAPTPTATLVRLFLLGVDVSDREAAAAFAPLALEDVLAAGIATRAGDRVRALLEIRPYAEQTGAQAEEADQWWVVSDLGSDVRPGPLARDHVLGIGNAALTLAQAIPRDRTGRALDVGTGCGVQSLHLARHAAAVTATDISERALRFAATTAGLSGQSWDLRAGSFLEPVEGETFELIVANPPFVVSPGSSSELSTEVSAEYDYRDSGLGGDRVCRDLVRGIVPRLSPGGTGQLLANWIVPTDGSWQERVREWFPAGSTAWVWQREVADLGEYVALWLRDAGQVPGTPAWTRRYDAWLDWFAAQGVAAVGMGLITFRRTDSPGPADVTAEDVPQAVEQPVAAEIASWFDRRAFLTGGTELLTTRFDVAPDLVRTHHDLLDETGWTTRRATLRQSHGLRWEIEVDDAVARIVAACAAGATPLVALDVLAATTGDHPADAADLAADFLPVLADLVQRGLLVPAP